MKPMKPLLGLPERWSNAPTAIIAVVILLLLAGIGIIAQNEVAYRDLQAQETRVQAEILAASVTAALDFGDNQATQEAVAAIRVNRQIRTVGIYDWPAGWSPAMAATAPIHRPASTCRNPPLSRQSPPRSLS